MDSPFVTLKLITPKAQLAGNAEYLSKSLFVYPKLAAVSYIHLILYNVTSGLEVWFNVFN